MKGRWKIALACVLGAGAGVVAGVTLRRPVDRLQFVHTDATGHEQRPCPADAFVIVVFGQSNSANFVAARHDPPPSILSHYDGKCWRARDPLLGAEGEMGNIAVPLAERLDPGKPVVIEALGIGSSSVDEWLNGELRKFYEARMSRLKATYPDVDLVVWIQGEEENDHDAPAFAGRLEAWMRRLRADFPGAAIGLTGTSYCLGDSKPAIVATQKAVAQRMGLTFLGETDAFISPADRFDDCHLSGLGAQRAVEMMARALAPARRRPPGQS